MLWRVCSCGQHDTNKRSCSVRLCSVKCGQKYKAVSGSRRDREEYNDAAQLHTTETTTIVKSRITCDICTPRDYREQQPWTLLRSFKTVGADKVKDIVELSRVFFQKKLCKNNNTNQHFYETNLFWRIKYKSWKKPKQICYYLFINVKSFVFGGFNNIFVGSKNFIQYKTFQLLITNNVRDMRNNVTLKYREWCYFYIKTFLYIRVLSWFSHPMSVISSVWLYKHIFCL